MRQHVRERVEVELEKSIGQGDNVCKLMGTNPKNSMNIEHLDNRFEPDQTIIVISHYDASVCVPNELDEISG